MVEANSHPINGGHSSENKETAEIPWIQPCAEVWEFCGEMANKYGVSQRIVYRVLEYKMKLFGLLHEKGARIVVSNGGENIEVDFFKAIRETPKSVAP